MRSNNWNQDSNFELEHEPVKYREISRDSNALSWNSNSECWPPSWNCSNAVFSEGVRITREGPVRHLDFTSFLEYGEEPKNYKEAVGLALRMVPHDYCSTLLVHHDPQADPQLIYLQEIRFKPKWTVRKFEETVYNYPKEARRRFVSTLTYDPDSRPRTFVSGLNVCAPVNSADLGDLLTPPSSPEVLQNGSYGTGNENETYQSTKVKLELDENANLFCATKDFTVNGV